MQNFTNDLQNEKSPYLLQHATNPVHWYPWGEKAFSKAKELDRPIFLSIGYATCHWCHVMEKESFQNENIAKELNKVFVCVKVDREEMPHVDSLYMDFAQAFISSGGGWPLNIVLTPDLKPFFATTYMPPDNAHGLMGIREMIFFIKNLWEGEEKKDVLAQSNQLVEIYKSCFSERGESFLTLEELKVLANEVLEDCDEVYGGFKKSPKFPLSYQNDFFLAFHALFSDERFSFINKLTLERMAKGGIYDQIGGGFSRYAVDEKWSIPHFEKMLYDNVLLLKSYLLSSQFFKDPTFEKIAKETLTYLERELFSSQAFYSAEDADSEGMEGQFYIWDYEELQAHLSEEEKSVFFEYFGVTIDGNFEGSNVLTVQKSLKLLSEKNKMPLKDLEEYIQKIKEKLFQVRETRKKPNKDDKILTSWNALAIIAFCKAFEIIEDEKYLDIAKTVMNFLLEYLCKENSLFRRYRDGEVKYSASFEDYAYVISALLSLFEITSESSYLEKAIDLTTKAYKSFKSPQGAFYSTEESEKHVILRKCEMIDGSLPSCNAIHAENLLKLYLLTKDAFYKESLEDVLKAATHPISQHPKSCMYFLKVYLRYLTNKEYFIVIALDEKKSLEKELRKYFSKTYIPFKTIVWKYLDSDQLCNKLNYLHSMKPLDGQTTLYVCDKDKCYPPLFKVEDLSKIISLCD